MKNKDLKPLVQTINSMMEVEISDVNVAFNVLKIHEKCSNALESLGKTLKLAVKYTEEEESLKKKIQELSQSATEENVQEINKQVKQLESDNPELTDSIKEKNKRYLEKDEELGKKPFKIDLPEIDIKDLPPLKLWQLNAFKPILKVK